MKVYLVISEVDYEGEKIHGPAYVSEAAATSAMKDMKANPNRQYWDRIDVHEMDVNQTVAKFDFTDLPTIARTINFELQTAGFSEDQQIFRQLLAMGEEVGEFIGAYRRYCGMARRSGKWEDVMEEWADVVITAFVTADALGLQYSDMRQVIESKIDRIFTRGWKDAPEMAGDGEKQKKCAKCGQNPCKCSLED